MRYRAILLAIHGVLTPTAAFAQMQVLTDVINEVRNAYNKQERPMVIFDLEGTLFDNRSRQLKIIKEYGEAELKKARPDDARKLEGLQVYNVQYRLTDTLNIAGISDAGVINNAAVFWSERFYSDDYVKYDTPTAGSVNFVRTLYSNGARIVYLTGRDQTKQLLGTVRALRDQGFPIGIQGTELIMKPTSQTQDAVYKQNVTNYLRHYGKVIATFDSEPANANVYKRAFADAKVILFTAPAAPNPPPLLPGVLPLGSFQ